MLINVTCAFFLVLINVTCAFFLELLCAAFGHTSYEVVDFPAVLTHLLEITAPSH